MSSYFEYAEVQCPHCGQVAEIAIDTAGDLAEEIVEDCPACCRPWELRIVPQGDGSLEIHVTRLAQD